MSIKKNNSNLIPIIYILTLLLKIPIAMDLFIVNYNKEKQLFQVILVLSYPYSLILMTLLNYVYDVIEVFFDIVSLSCPFLIMIS